MKNSYVAVLVVAAVGVTAGIQEWRISGLRKSAEQVEVANGPERRTTARSHPAEATDGPRRHLSEGVSGNEPASDGKDTFSRSIRRMWDNSAGKVIMNQGVRVSIAMIYEDYIETLGLTEEEEKYFKDLLAGEMAVQQEFGMKMMGVTPEERTGLMEELKEVMEQNEQDIRTFLNDDQDFDAYLSYKERIPDRQQLEGIRATMDAREVPMDEATETRLIEAIHKARTQPGLADFSGDGAFGELAGGDLEERFEQTWQKQQETLRAEVGFLSDAQKKAFFEYQEQLKEFQLTSLKVTQQIMKPGEPE